MNDLEAVKALKNGDEKGVEFLFDRYYERLVAYIMTYLHDKMSAEDIAQQAFVDLWNYKNNLNDLQSPKSYLYTIAFNRYIDRIKSEQKQSKLLNTIYEKALRDRIEDDEETTALRIKKMNTLIQSLPPKCQTILKLNKIEGLKYKEIADQLNISVKTVEAQMAIAFKKIRDGFYDDPLILFLIKDESLSY